MKEVGKNSIFTFLKTKFLKKMPLKLKANIVNHCNSNGVSLPHFAGESLPNSHRIQNIPLANGETTLHYNCRLFWA